MGLGEKERKVKKESIGKFKNLKILSYSLCF